MKLLYIIIIISIIILITLGLGIYIIIGGMGCDSGFRRVNCDKNSKISSYCVKKEEKNVNASGEVPPCDLCTLGDEEDS